MLVIFNPMKIIEWFSSLSLGQLCAVIFISLFLLACWGSADNAMKNKTDSAKK